MVLRLSLAVVLLLGAALSGFGIYFIALGNEARQWPEVKGTVTSTVIRTSFPTSHGTTMTRAERERLKQFYPVITYRWSVEGQQYSGSMYQLGTTYEKFNERAEALSAARKFGNGTEVSVFYNPSNHSQAVLDRSASWAIYVPLVLGMLFLAMGAVCFRNIGAVEAAFQSGGQSSDIAGF